MEASNAVLRGVLFPDELGLRTIIKDILRLPRIGRRINEALGHKRIEYPDGRFTYSGEEATTADFWFKKGLEENLYIELIGMNTSAEEEETRQSLVRYFLENPEARERMLAHPHPESSQIERHRPNEAYFQNTGLDDRLKDIPTNLGDLDFPSVPLLRLRSLETLLDTIKSFDGDVPDYIRTLQEIAEFHEDIGSFEEIRQHTVERIFKQPKLETEDDGSSELIYTEVSWREEARFEDQYEYEISLEFEVGANFDRLKRFSKKSFHAGMMLGLANVGFWPAIVYGATLGGIDAAKKLRNRWMGIYDERPSWDEKFSFTVEDCSTPVVRLRNKENGWTGEGEIELRSGERYKLIDGIRNKMTLFDHIFPGKYRMTITSGEDFDMSVSLSPIGRLPSLQTKKKKLITSKRSRNGALYSTFLGAIFNKTSLQTYGYSHEVYPKINQLLDDLEGFDGHYEELTLAAALAKWASEGNKKGYDITIPELGDDPSVVKDAVHPISAVRERNQVPNDYDESQTRFKIMTGPNASGKSVYGRTIALTHILGRAGFPVFASSTYLQRKDQVLTLIPKDGDLSTNDSRAEIEAQRMSIGWDRLTDRTLVFFDETGSTAAESAASPEIQENVELYGLAGVSGVMCVHMHSLIDFADADPRIGNISTVLDENEQPTYKVLDGSNREQNYGKILKKHRADADSGRMILRDRIESGDFPNPPKELVEHLYQSEVDEESA